MTNNPITPEDVAGNPGLTVFLWEDGAPFEWLMVVYAGLDFPPGMGPLGPAVGLSMLNNASLVARFEAAKDNTP